MRIICVQTGVPGYTFDWVGIYAKFKEVSQWAAPLPWPCMNFTAQKRINTEQEINIVISSLTKIFTNKMYNFLLLLLLVEWRLVSHIVDHLEGILPAIVAQNRVSNFFSGSAMGLNKECQFSWLYFLRRLAFLIVGASKNGKEFDFNLLFYIYKCTSLSTERFSRGTRNKCFQICSTLLWILRECEGE